MRPSVVVLALVICLSGCLGSPSSEVTAVRETTSEVELCYAQAAEDIVLYGCPEEVEVLSFSSGGSERVAPSDPVNLTGYGILLIASDLASGSVSTTFRMGSETVDAYLGTWDRQSSALYDDTMARSEHVFLISTCDDPVLDVHVELSAAAGSFEVHVWEFIDNGSRIMADGERVDPSCSGATSHQGATELPLPIPSRTVIGLRP